MLYGLRKKRFSISRFGFPQPEWKKKHLNTIYINIYSVKYSDRFNYITTYVLESFVLLFHLSL